MNAIYPATSSPATTATSTATVLSVVEDSYDYDYASSPVSSLSFSDSLVVNNKHNNKHNNNNNMDTEESPLQKQLQPAYQVKKKWGKRGSHHGRSSSISTASTTTFSTSTTTTSATTNSTIPARSLSSSSDGSAGIFIDHGRHSKPMPMTTGRSILRPALFPAIRRRLSLSGLLYQHEDRCSGRDRDSKNRSATILRRTSDCYDNNNSHDGQQDSCVFSDPLNELKASRYLHDQVKEEKQAAAAQQYKETQQQQQQRDEEEEEETIDFTSTAATGTSSPADDAVDATATRSVSPGECSSSCRSRHDCYYYNYYYRWDCQACGHANSMPSSTMGDDPFCVRCGTYNSKFQLQKHAEMLQHIMGATGQRKSSSPVSSSSASSSFSSRRGLAASQEYAAPPECAPQRISKTESSRKLPQQTLHHQRWWKRWKEMTNEKLAAAQNKQTQMSAPSTTTAVHQVSQKSWHPGTAIVSFVFVFVFRCVSEVWRCSNQFSCFLLFIVIFRVRTDRFVHGIGHRALLP